MGEQLFTILRIARCYRTHLTGGYLATDLADPSPKLPYQATSHIRQPLSEILGMDSWGIHRNL